MTSTDSPADCLERARMHERLAQATEDAPARAMHQAMASEYRRRAADMESNRMPPTAVGPVLQMHVAAQ
jgi:hypothetical protein